MRRLILLACCWCAAAQAREEVLDLAGLQVTMWSQEQAADARQPVLVFSHGFHGCDTQSRFLMEAFAAAGYLVFAPNHRDATCHGGKSNWLQAPALPFWRPDLWSDSTYRSRADDLRRVIDALHDDVRFGGRADWSRLGLVGHSLGGYTVLGLGGAWPGWKIPGVKAVLALAPYSHPFVLQRTLPGLSAPVMYQCGVDDALITAAVSQPLGSYEQSPAPKYYVELAHAGHLVWTNTDPTDRQAILAYSLAFMNHYVKGEPAQPLLTRAAPGAAQLRYASELGSSEAGPAGAETP